MLEFILSTIGLTLIITTSYIFTGFRNHMAKISPKLGKLFKCSMCLGFWNGLIIKSLLFIYYGVTFTYFSPIIILLYGFIGSITSFVVYLLIKPLMDKHG